MPTILCSDIFALANRQLHDVAGQTWPSSVMIPYLNLAIYEICNYKPEAYPVTKTVTLMGGPVQSLDDNAIELLDIICNMGTDGLTPGPSVPVLKKEAVDTLVPDWQTYTPGSVVLFSMIDSRNPKYYYTVPPIAVTNPMPKLKLIQAEMPDKIVDPSDEYPLDASYVPAAVDYLIFRALAESTTIPGAMQKAGVFLNKFTSNLGIKTAVEMKTERKQEATGEKTE